MNGWFNKQGKQDSQQVALSPDMMVLRGEIAGPDTDTLRPEHTIEVHEAYVRRMLSLARYNVVRENAPVAVGEKFLFKLEDFPTDMLSRHGVTVGLMTLASEYGLRCDHVNRDDITFKRIW